MNADIIHNIQLTRAVKHYLITKKIVDNIDNTFINGVEFSGTKKEGKSIIETKIHNVTEWIESLITKGLKDVFFYTPMKGIILHPYAFQNVTQGILIRYESYSELWMGQLEFDIKELKWNIYYKAYNIRTAWVNNTTTFHMAALKKSLWNMKELAKEITEKSWERIFEQAYMILTETSEYENPYFLDTMTKEMQQIFYACDKGWVFGGLSNFSDIPPLHAYEKGLENKFRLYTNDYHDKLVQAILYSVNS